MSDSYYLISKSKKMEYEKFQYFWEDILTPLITQLIDDYTAHRAAENPEEEEYIRSICEQGHRRCAAELKYCPVTDYECMQKIGSYSGATQRFTWTSGMDYPVSGKLIESMNALTEFLKENPDVMLCNDCGYPITIEAFRRETKL
jgi:hypothetical protein